MADDQTNGGAPAAETPGQPMTPAQRLAYLEDLFVMMTIIVLAASRKVKNLDPEVVDQLEIGTTVLVSQQAFRTPAEQY